MGYTPAFDSIYTGTLYGQWPTAAVWASLLPLIDSKGQIDMTYEAIAGMTGWPLDLLKQGIRMLMQPDPRSRSSAEEGRRLAPLNGERDWGWRAVNIQLYRKRASGQNQVIDGRNAAKVKRYKEGHLKTPPDTPDTAGHSEHRQTRTHTQTQTQTEDSSLRSLRAPARARSRRVPADFLVSPEMREWAKQACPGVDLDRETEAFRDHEYKDPHSDWLAAWRQWMRRAPDFRSRTAAEPERTWRPTDEESGSC